MQGDQWNTCLNSERRPRDVAQIESLFEALTQRDVRYVVVGGVAVVLHGHPRLTADVDLAIDLDPEPLAHTMQVLTELGFEPQLPVSVEQFMDPTIRAEWMSQRNMTVFSLHSRSNSLLTADIFAENPIAFADLWRDAVQIALSATTVRVASISHLIEMKLLAGRPKDLEDIAHLRDIENHHD
jgi:hypothetical protein